MFIGRTDAEAETPVLWPPHAKSWLIGKDPDVGRDWRQEEKGTAEDEMAGWHHRLDGHEFEWTPGVGDGQGGLVCCDSWGPKESDRTERLNWTEAQLQQPSRSQRIPPGLNREMPGLSPENFDLNKTKKKYVLYANRLSFLSLPIHVPDITCFFFFVLKMWILQLSLFQSLKSGRHHPKDFKNSRLPYLSLIGRLCSRECG